MKLYKIELDETIAEFFEEVAVITKNPIEIILSNALFKQVEDIKLNIANYFVIDEE